MTVVAALALSTPRQPLRFAAIFASSRRVAPAQADKAAHAKLVRKTKAAVPATEIDNFRSGQRQYSK
jgi:hypothetical protein